MCSPTGRFRFLLQFSLAAILILLGGWPSAAHALDAVTLQLRWSHAFQFAGYYAAKERGYYREAGLDVAIQEAHPGDDPLKSVLDGKAQYGVGNSSLLLARNSGQPVVVLASIFQHSPLVLIARTQGSTQGIHDLAGKRLMIESHADELLAYLKQMGIPLAGTTRIEHSFQPQDLIDGKVDAISAYITNEPYFLDRAGFAYHTYTPRSIGIDFYGDNLFTTEQQLRNHPDQVKAFREASLRGWQYAMAHPEEIADLILSKYSQQHPREFYLFEAARMVDLLRTDLIEVGYMHPGRWRHMADTYADLGLLPNNFTLDGFLYKAKSQQDPTWFYLAGMMLAIVSIITLYIHRTNRRLTQALAASKETQELLRVSEERHRLLADNATDVIWMMNLEGRFTYVSPSVETLRGYTSAEVMQQPLEQALTAASIPIATKALGDSITAMLAGKPFVGFRGELEQPCKDGSTVWTDVTTCGMQNSAGEFIGILGVTRNITERKKAEDARRESEEKLKAVFNVAEIGIAITDRNGAYVMVNDWWCEHLGYDHEVILKLKNTDVTHPDDREESRSWFLRLVEGEVNKYRLEKRFMRKDGSFFWADLSAAPIRDARTNSITYVVGMVTDITQRKEMEDQVRQLAFHDPLTGLPNRRLLLDRLAQTMTTSKRSGLYGALMFLDLDNFKPLNDMHGHVVGDLLLIEVAKRLKASVREMDTVGRIGGDEFVVIFSELGGDKAQSTEQAAGVAEKIRASLAVPYQLTVSQAGEPDKTVEHHCSSSIGVVVFVNHETSQADLMKWADAAMYQAKDAGRNAIRFHGLPPNSTD